MYTSLLPTSPRSSVQNCIGSRVRIPQFDSAQKPQTGVVTGSKPTLAFTCYPPVPKPEKLRTTQECSFATVYHSLYATVAYPDMQRWHKVNDTPSQNCIPGSCGVSPVWVPADSR